MEWQPIALPGYIAERFIAVSIPLGSEVALVSYEGIHMLDLEDPLRVRHDRSSPEGGKHFDKHLCVLDFEGKKFRMLGLCGGAPILRSSHGDAVNLEKAAERLVVRGPAGPALEYKYEDLSGDWAFASFSEDGRYVVLGLPYEFVAFRRIP
jgi:hypothetical protein